MRVKLPGNRSMAMASGESVSGTLIHRSDLPETGLVALEVVIDGESESIFVDCDRTGSPGAIAASQGRRLDYAPGRFLLDRGQLCAGARRRFSASPTESAWRTLPWRAPGALRVESSAKALRFARPR